MTAADFVNAYWPYMVVALAILIALCWFLALANRKTSVVSDRRDVLDEGAERAKRNQALIDAGQGPGELSQAANATPTAPATELADAEAGASVEPTRSSPAGGDDLTRIKGLGPKIASILNVHGVTRFAQIAEWNEAEIDEIDAKLGKFAGRIRRDAWIEQAKLLSSGDESGFSAKFGQNG